MKISARNFSAMNSVTMENAGEKHDTAMEREAISLYRKSTPCVVSEKNWNTKEDKGRSMIHTLYILWLAKRHISG